MHFLCVSSPIENNILSNGERLLIFLCTFSWRSYYHRTRIIAYGEGISHNFTSEIYNLKNSKRITVCNVFGDALLSHKNKFYIM